MAMRTFFALDIDEALRRQLAEVQGRVGAGSAKINWVRAENLHVTLNFLGDVGDELLADVSGLAARAAAGVEPFEFHVRGVSCVPPRGQVRMIWADVTDPTGRMAALHDAVADCLAGLGFKEEVRRFKGHITLARVKFAPDPRQLRGAVAGLAMGDFPEQSAAELVGYTSRLGLDGPTYTAIIHAPLGG